MQLKSRVLNDVKMGLTPPRAASVTVCAHTTRAVAKTMNPYVVLVLVETPFLLTLRMIMMRKQTLQRHQTDPDHSTKF